MFESASRLTVSQEGTVTVVELVDKKILDEVAIMEIGEQIGALVEQHDLPTIILDFRNVRHLSSSALGMLITVHKHVREKDGRLRLCGIQPSIEEVFAMTRLNEIFDMRPSRAEALAGLD